MVTHGRRDQICAPALAYEPRGRYHIDQRPGGGTRRTARCPRATDRSVPPLVAECREPFLHRLLVRRSGVLTLPASPGLRLRRKDCACRIRIFLICVGEPGVATEQVLHRLVHAGDFAVISDLDYIEEAADVAEIPCGLDIQLLVALQNVLEEGGPETRILEGRSECSGAVTVFSALLQFLDLRIAFLDSLLERHDLR